MPEPVVSTPYRIRCRDCEHPGKFHGMTGCIMKECNCKRLEAEELEHELCIDALTGKQICVICSSDKDLSKGLCATCRNKARDKEAEEKKNAKST